MVALAGDSVSEVFDGAGARVGDGSGASDAGGESSWSASATPVATNIQLSMQKIAV
jgi:hypothetical protein